MLNLNQSHEPDINHLWFTTHDLYDNMWFTSHDLYDHYVFHITWSLWSFVIHITHHTIFMIIYDSHHVIFMIICDSHHMIFFVIVSHLCSLLIRITWSSFNTPHPTYALHADRWHIRPSHDPNHDHFLFLNHKIVLFTIDSPYMISMLWIIFQTFNNMHKGNLLILLWFTSPDLHVHSVAYLGFQKGGPNVCWTLVLTQRGGKTKFSNFLLCKKKQCFYVCQK